MKIRPIPRKTTLCFVFLFLIGLLCTSPISPSKAASVIPASPCDSLYYETLSARAWLEAQREITQNQNIILKPDSVFEYSCFDGLLNELADHADEMLSESGAYSSPLNSTSMDTALQNLVASSVASYTNSNFGYYPGLLGGHISAAAIKHVPGNINAATFYSCDIMRRVWQAAKCINFVSNSSTDGFFTLAEYSTTTDKRILPTAAFACVTSTTQWTANLSTALTSGPWTMDPVQTYINETTPQSCGGANCPCTGDPIPTGIIVTRAGAAAANYPENVCLQPGCRYRPVGGGITTAGCYGE